MNPKYTQTKTFTTSDCINLGGISLGESGDDFLQRKIRAHGNFIEYAPIFLIMLLF